MKLSPKLYALIHSLNKNEKGYFVKFAQSQGSNSEYLHLFHAIYKLPEYNQKALRESFAGANFLKHIGYYQNYLYKMILKSLRLYHENQEIDIQLYGLLSELRVLEIKGLKKESALLLKSIKKKALKHHQYPILIEVLKKQAIQIVATKEKDLFLQTNKIYDEIFEAASILEQEYTYRKLNHSILLCFRNGAWTSLNKFSNLLSEIRDHPLMEDRFSPTSFFAQYLKFNIRCIEAKIGGERQTAYEYHKKILGVWENYPEMIKANSNLYKIHISNYLGNAILLGKVDHFEKYVQVMEDLRQKNDKDKTETFQNILYFKLLFYLNQNRLEEGKEYLESIQTKLQKHAPQFNHARAIAIYYNALVLYFLLEDFEKAQKWVNIILDEQNKTIRKDVKFFARIMNLIIHFELDHDQLIEYFYSSVKRQLTSKTQENDYEKVILSHFKNLMNTLPGKERQNAFSQFRKNLIPFKQVEPEPISIYELLIWLAARVEKKSLRSIYAQTLLQKDSKV